MSLSAGDAQGLWLAVSGYFIAPIAAVLVGNGVVSVVTGRDGLPVPPPPPPPPSLPSAHLDLCLLRKCDAVVANLLFELSWVHQCSCRADFPNMCWLQVLPVALGSAVLVLALFAEVQKLTGVGTSNGGKGGDAL